MKKHGIVCYRKAGELAYEAVVFADCVSYKKLCVAPFKSLRDGKSTLELKYELGVCVLDADERSFAILKTSAGVRLVHGMRYCFCFATWKDADSEICVVDRNLSDDQLSTIARTLKMAKVEASLQYEQSVFELQRDIAETTYAEWKCGK